MSLYYLLFYFFIYGFLGWCSEVAFAAFKEKKFVNRGFLNGPICPVYGFGVGFVVSLLMPYKSNVFFMYIGSVIAVSAIEWVTGFALEKIFHSRWWDYSEQPFNLNGYICLPFSLIWGAACMLIVYIIHPLIIRLAGLIPMLLGSVLLIVLLIGMAADVWVTASGIFKMNQRLRKMSELADELHNISDQLGENIYQGVMTAMVKQEETKKKLDEAGQELKERKDAVQAELKDRKENLGGELEQRMQELKDRYQEIAGKKSQTSTRLLKAFPAFDSNRYKDALDELKKRIKNK
ncbi:putative ABC transporter permease [Anaerostipes sp.]|uniref:putative ABC transporter permease n=1 Tax=Anaerostipes sp. TaxID=1872530 RepID=UPI0025C1EA6F|nr:hypothetical protein [Anaerostipes sp.]MBS7008252.1 hypothetical protein [Anaerostipes sp.]